MQLNFLLLVPIIYYRLTNTGQRCLSADFFRLQKRRKQFRAVLVHGLVPRLLQGLSPFVPFRVLFFPSLILRRSSVFLPSVLQYILDALPMLKILFLRVFAFNRLQAACLGNCTRDTCQVLLARGSGPCTLSFLESSTAVIQKES